MATPTPGQAPPAGPADDPLPEAVALARGAADAGLGLKLLGGLAVRVLCPDFPPRQRAGQDMDFACLSKGRKNVVAYLERSGCEPDRRFNNLNGDRQMYFTAPSGRPIDVMVDRLTMCHTLDFRPSFGRLPLTVDAVDVLLSKLQIVELNEKDARDILHLLAGVPVSGTDGQAAAGAARRSTATGSASCSARTGAGGARSPATWTSCPRWPPSIPELIPPDPPLDPLAQSEHLLRAWPSRRPRASSGSCGPTSATGSAGTNCRRKSITDRSRAMAALTSLLRPVSRRGCVA